MRWASSLYLLRYWDVCAVLLRFLEVVSGMYGGHGGDANLDLMAMRGVYPRTQDPGVVDHIPSC